MQVRELAVFAGPADRKAASDLLESLEAAPPGDELFMKVGSILLDYTEGKLRGEAVSPVNTLRQIVT